MTRELSRGARRFFVVANYASIACFVLAFAAAEYVGWSFTAIGALVVLAIVAAQSFHGVFARTGLWRLVHARGETLDEREVQLTREALRTAYAVFTVVVLLYILFVNLVARFDFLPFEPKTRGAVGSLALATLIYFAHTLPAAVIAWREGRLAVD